MADNRHIFTSESVTEGHPDKMADQISDAVLDAVLRDDPTGRVACEVLVTTGICIVAGEITTKTYVDVPKIAREVIADIGYTDAAYGFDPRHAVYLNCDSGAVARHRDGRGYGRRGRPGPDVRLCLRRDSGTDAAADHAGTQAVRSVSARSRTGGTLNYLRPDGKSQVSVEYVNGKPPAHRCGRDFHAAWRRCLHRSSFARTSASTSSIRLFPRTWWTRTRSITSIRPAVS